ncbi:hypothetical protein EVG20_g5244 [Dentipellis fragilis]|uniref:PhoD-like phosphatase metallophosphatase domain-containing protein n=1 Tax=Dentipellis fragilis TaxID=205917 RepID=A0A4Y9YUJ0_9AGAM|nr:hypothetical protein EVG20_g5244 [Dentipellis fragilis]
MANALVYLSALSSSLFRLFSYLFLRVIPAQWCKTILPVLYLTYLASSSPRKSARIIHTNTTPYSTPRNVEPAGVDLLWQLIFSLPTSRLARIATFVTNTLLLIAAADLALQPVINSAQDVVFTRTGAVYPDAAKIVVRYPAVYSTNHTLRILWRKAEAVSSGWNDGPVLELNPEHDWVNTTKLQGLWPSTDYEYTIAHTNNTLLSTLFGRFRTFPDPHLPGGSHFRFVVTSCIMPNFPYTPFHSRTIKGFDLLAEHLSPFRDLSLSEAVNISQVPAAQFMLFLGDFIYADVPLYFGDTPEAYRRLYRRNYQSPSYKKIYERLPIFHAYDDHEIINNYAGQANDSLPPFPNAEDAFRIYNADANYESYGQGRHYFEFHYGDVAFFVMDTRRYRSHVSPHDGGPGTMLGQQQLRALFTWLQQVNTTTTFKFIVSSVPFTSLWMHDATTDSWAGYPHEKTALLDALHTVPNVVVLSGDRHEFAAIQFNSANEAGHGVLEFSTSPMNMFYIPLVRTLRMESDNMVLRQKTPTDEASPESSEAGPEYIPKEKVLKYLPLGNSKWSTIEVDTTNPDEPTLKLQVMIDGKIAYNLTVVGQPIQSQAPSGLALLVPDGMKNVLAKIGLQTLRWF